MLDFNFLPLIAVVAWGVMLRCMWLAVIDYLQEAGK